METTTKEFEGLEFKYSKELDKCDCYLVETIEQWRVVLPKLMEAPMLGVDTETNGFSAPAGDRICGISVGYRDTHFYIPVRHKESLLGGAVERQLSITEIKDDLISLFARTDLTILGFNFRFDAKMFLADGIPVTARHHDVLLLWKFFDEESPAALKTISSGWRDHMGRKKPPVVHKDAASNEKELKLWRQQEARARRAEFTKAVNAEAELLATDPVYQSHKKNELKKIARASLEKTHRFAEASVDDVSYDYVPVPMMLRYAAVDTYLTWYVFEYLSKALNMNEDQLKLYRLEMDVSKHLQDLELKGVLIDRKYLEDLSPELEKQMVDVEKDVAYALGVEEVSMGSSRQLSELMIGAGIQLTEKTPTGEYKLDSEVLDSLAKKYPVAENILAYRSLTKLKSTYVDAILRHLDPHNYLYCNFNQVPKTGRLSSSNPNLQNIPRDDNRIRKAFIVPEDYLFIFCDWSQIELRILAHVSQDPLLLRAYRQNLDLHSQTAALVFGYKYENFVKILHDDKHPEYKKVKMLRSIGKTIGFSIIYGTGPKGLSTQINPRPDQYRGQSDKEWVTTCRGFIDRYLDTHRGVRKFINDSTRLVRSKRQISSMYGRVRHLPHVRAVQLTGNDDLEWMHSKACRQGTNHVIQGTAADMFKMAFVNVAKLLEGTKSRVVNLVHDDIQIYLHKDELHLINDIKRTMEDFPEFTVPIVVDVEYSKTSWGDKKELQ